MISLFSNEAARTLKKIKGQNTLYAFDFDGTLSPIVRRPEAAFMRRSTLALLKKLATGRPSLLFPGEECPSCVSGLVLNLNSSWAVTD